MTDHNSNTNNGTIMASNNTVTVNSKNANSSGGGGGGLLSKKLWFPSYVDAGANVAFREASAATTTTATTIAEAETEAVSTTPNIPVAATMSPQESSTGGVSSDAITEIYDNRTRSSQAKMMSMAKRRLAHQKKRMDPTSTTKTTTTAATTKSTVDNSNAQEQQDDDPHGSGIIMEEEKKLEESSVHLHNTLEENQIHGLMTVSQDAISEVNSAASEMGTVIDYSYRLAQLDDENDNGEDGDIDAASESHHHHQQQQHRHHQVHSHHQQQQQHQQELFYRTPIENIEEDDEEGDHFYDNLEARHMAGLSLPTLEFRSEHEGAAATNNHNNNNVNNSNNNTTTTTTASSHPATPSATAIVSATLRRLGNGLTRQSPSPQRKSKNQTHTTHSSSSSSAPSTPRRASGGDVTTAAPSSTKSSSSSSVFLSRLSGSKQQQQQSNKRPIWSAPSTPNPVYEGHGDEQDDYEKEDDGNDNDHDGMRGPPPASFLLRSPGSSVHQSYYSAAARKEKVSQPKLAPRFTTTNQTLSTTSTTGATPTASAAVDPAFTPKSSLVVSALTPFRLARGCFSFDTSMEDQQHRPLPSDYVASKNTGANVNYHNNNDTSSGAVEYVGSTTPAYNSNSHERNVLASSLSWDERRLDAFQGRTTLQHRPTSLSSQHQIHLKISPPSATATTRMSATKTAFRELPKGSGRSYHNFYGQPEFAYLRQPEGAAAPLEEPSAEEEEPFRVRLGSDCSPRRANKAATMELQTPERIEIEREDALDILACLVGRGVALDLQEDDKIGDSNTAGTKQRVADADDSISNSTMGQATDESNSDKSKKEIQKSATISKALTENDESLSEISLAVDALRNLSKKYAEEQDAQLQADHKARMKAIDELLRSHTYAVEMRRAAVSASAWLRSIGRAEGCTDQSSREVGDDEEDGELAVNTASAGSKGRQQAAGEEELGSPDFKTVDRIDLLTLKAMLQTARLEAKEKAALADKLNQELSECRAEIGRLRTSSRTESQSLFLSPDRSILDDHDDESVASAASRNDFGNISPIQKVGDSAPSNPLTNEASGNEDVVSLRLALERANEIIRQLYSQACEVHNAGVSNDDVPLDGSPALLSERKSNFSPDSKMVHVRMLDGENFITDWSELTPPLSPPPDHDLRAPIVTALLEQWTSDKTLHGPLLSWMDHIISGGSIESVPPLTISSLDHQVRDGFAMHILPLLLKRPDIHVQVKTRAHRRTNYDIAVSVTSKHEHTGSRNETLSSKAAPLRMSGQNSPANGQPDPFGFPSGKGNHFVSQSVTESSLTEHTTNASRRLVENGALTDGRPSFGEIPVRRTGSHFDAASATSSAGASGDFNSAGQAGGAGIISALGGALGGLLTRHRISENGELSRETESSPSQLWKSSDVRPAPPDDEDEPYHRVVSAPPGRIGVTFVEFRGHAMVSDVAATSPLYGWVFPSDILIAIDEVPVSGMRVRDIVKLLTTRNQRQRALRVISSHAMNEFTLNTSGMNDAN